MNYINGSKGKKEKKKVLVFCTIKEIKNYKTLVLITFYKAKVYITLFLSYNLVNKSTYDMKMIYKL